MSRFALLPTALFLTVLVFDPQAARSQAYPERIITLVVPFPAGGPTDVTARVLATKLSQTLGEAIVIENKPGASGNLAAQSVARAQPDGYTLFFGTGGTHGANAALYSDIGYRPVEDFEPIVWVTTSPNILVVQPSFPAKSLQELIDLVKANPDKFDAAAPGPGSTPYMFGELLMHQAGMKMVHVTYRGSGPALNDLLGGHVKIMFDGIPSSMPLVQSGQLRALAVTGTSRLTTAPDIPTVAETIPGFDASGWFGIYAPAKTPPAIIQKLNAAINQALADEDLKKTYAELGAITVGGSSEKLAAQVKAELAKWSDLVKATGIKLQ
jgi:tripartite-type tricarboxylate transporter receptor subunit TctC